MPFGFGVGDAATQNKNTSRLDKRGVFSAFRLWRRGRPSGEVTCMSTDHGISTQCLSALASGTPSGSFHAKDSARRLASSVPFGFGVGDALGGSVQKRSGLTQPASSVPFGFGVGDAAIEWVKKEIRMNEKRLQCLTALASGTPSWGEMEKLVKIAQRVFSALRLWRRGRPDSKLKRTWPGNGVFEVFSAFRLWRRGRPSITGVDSLLRFKGQYSVPFGFGVGDATGDNADSLGEMVWSSSVPFGFGVGDARIRCEFYCPA